MTLRQKKTAFQSIAALAAIAAALFGVIALATVAGPADAKSKKAKAAAVSKKVPTVTAVDPMTAAIGDDIAIKGTRFTVGSRKMTVVFQRAGGKRFTSRATAATSKTLIVKVPDVSADLPGGPAKYSLRLINKYGIMKKATPASLSPTLTLPTTPGGNANLDCDKDGQPNLVDTDDDNDLLIDTIEIAITTDACYWDSDDDEVSDYYEYRVALEFNGAPFLPYPGLQPVPDPVAGDADNDLDNDDLTMLQEYTLWQFTGRLDRFYSDADQDSDDNGTDDTFEDEDSDLLGNWIELNVFDGSGALRELNFVKRDSDGDGLCDGLDDQEHDGDATPVAEGDCDSPVPNNSVPGDPDPFLIDGDDNVFSNIGEILFLSDPYDPCDPSPASKYC